MLLEKTVKWKTNGVIFFHTSFTIQSIQKSIPTLGSSDKDEDEVRDVQNIAFWDRPEAQNDSDSKKLHLYMLGTLGNCVSKLKC